MKKTLYKYGIALLITLMLAFAASECHSQTTYPLSHYTVQYDEYSDVAGVDDHTFNKILVSCLINRLYVINKHAWLPSETSVYNELRTEVEELKRKVDLTEGEIDKIEWKVDYSSWNDYTSIQKRQIKTIEYLKGIRNGFE